MFERMKIQLPDALKDIDNDGVYENLKVLWDLVQNRPSTFPPASHQHGDADLLGIDWSKVLNKPSAFPSNIEHVFIGTGSATSSGGHLFDLTSVPVSNEEIYIFITTYGHMTGMSGANGIVLLPNGNVYDSAFKYSSLEIYYDSSSSSTATRFSNNPVIAGDQYFNGGAVVIGHCGIDNGICRSICFYIPHLASICDSACIVDNDTTLVPWHIHSSTTTQANIPLENLGIVAGSEDSSGYTYTVTLNVWKVKL